MRFKHLYSPCFLMTFIIFMAAGEKLVSSGSIHFFKANAGSVSNGNDIAQNINDILGSSEVK